MPESSTSLLHPSTDATTLRKRRPSKRLWLALALVLLLMALDLSRPPRKQWSAAVLLGGIHLYQATLSPLMPYVGVRCRFQPTCSRYAEARIQRYGALVGTWRTFVRIARCGPWTPAGTYDPP